MGSSGFDDIRVFLFQPRERVCELIERREQAVFDGLYGRDVHRGREGVIAALRFVDMVVGMHELFAENFIRAIGDDFVDVHIGLCAASRLIDDERKVILQFSADDLVGCLLNRDGSFFIQRAKRKICLRGGFFEDTEGMDDLFGHSLRSNLKIFVAALRLRAPVAVSRYADFAHGVVFDTVFHSFLLIS